MVGGKTGDYLPPRQGSPDPGKGLRPLIPVPQTGFSCFPFNGSRPPVSGSIPCWYLRVNNPAVANLVLLDASSTAMYALANTGGFL